MSGSAPPNLTVFSNGVGVLNDATANGFVQSGALLADLRNFPGLSQMTVQLIGTTIPGDGGAGMFYWNPTATTADDDGATSVAPYGVTFGRWLRIPQSSSQPGVFTNTQMNTPYTFLLGGLVPGDFYHVTHPLPHNATIGLVAGVAVPADSTVYEADAIAGYASTLSTATPAVGGSFYAYNLAPGTVSYGLNPLVSDGGFASTVVGLEVDIGAANAGSSAYGCNMIGVFTGGTPATAIAYQASVLNSPWQYTLVSYDGATESFALVGAMGTTANSNGQPIQFNVRDASNTVQICGIQTQSLTAGANMVISTPSGALVVNNAFVANEGMSVIALSGVLTGYFSGVTNVGSVTTNGTTTTYNTTSDATLKIDDGLIDAEQALAIVRKLKPRWFRWKSDPDSVSRPGFFAQQVNRVFPWAVTKGIKNKRPWQMDNATLMPVVIRALQALVSENIDLKRRVSILERGR